MSNSEGKDKFSIAYMLGKNEKYIKKYINKTNFN